MIRFRILDGSRKFQYKNHSMHKSTIIKNCFHNTICVWRLFQHILANVTNKFLKKHDMEHESLNTPCNVSLISIKIFNGNILPHGTNYFPSGFLATIFLFFEKVKSIFIRNDPTFELFATIVTSCCYIKWLLYHFNEEKQYLIFRLALNIFLM